MELQRRTEGKSRNSIAAELGNDSRFARNFSADFHYNLPSDALILKMKCLTTADLQATLRISQLSCRCLCRQRFDQIQSRQGNRHSWLIYNAFCDKFGMRSGMCTDCEAEKSYMA